MWCWRRMSNGWNAVCFQWQKKNMSTLATLGTIAVARTGCSDGPFPLPLLWWKLWKYAKGIKMSQMFIGSCHSGSVPCRQQVPRKCLDFQMITQTSCPEVYGSHTSLMNKERHGYTSTIHKIYILQCTKCRRLCTAHKTLGSAERIFHFHEWLGDSPHWCIQKEEKNILLTSTVRDNFLNTNIKCEWLERKIKTGKLVVPG